MADTDEAIGILKYEEDHLLRRIPGLKEDIESLETRLKTARHDLKKCKKKLVSIRATVELLEVGED